MTGVYSNELNTMQSALIEYVTALEYFLDSTKEIRATYNAIAQVDALQNQRANLNKAKGNAELRISSAADNLKEHIISKWTPKETLYNREVVSMLQDGLISYSVDDIETMAEERFADNPTMLQVLRGYLEKNELFGNLKSDSVLMYASKSKKVETAENLKNELLGIINNTENIESVRYAAENFEKAFQYKLNIIGQF